MRHVTPDGLNLVRHFEGFRAAPYKCPAGVWTIGYGTTFIGGLPVTERTPAVSEDAATTLLVADMVRFEQSVLRLIKAPLADGQFDALVDFVYNFGGGKLQSSTLRALVNRGEHADVPAEFMKWTRGGGRVLPGLIRRRAAEAALYVG